MWAGIRPLLGTVVGVGFFSLPYVFSRAGFGLALVELGVLIVAQIFFLHAYADLTLMKKGHAQFLRIVGDAFGPVGKFFAVMSFFGTLWGAMIAYILAGGEFASYIAKAWDPAMTSRTLSLGFGAFLFVALLGGGFVVRRVQKYLVPLFFVIIGVLVMFSFPHVALENFTSITLSAWVMPLGVLLFSLGAISAVPEMRDVLGGNGKRLRQAITRGLLLTGMVYAVFAAMIVGLAGGGTPPQAIAAFAGVAPWMVLLGSLLGISVVTTAYIHVGSALVHTLLYDFRMRILPALLLVGGVPYIAVVSGVDDVIGVLEYTGGVLSALLSILVLIAYEKARRARQLPAHTRALSSFVLFGLFALYFVMLVFTLRGNV